MSAFDIIGVNFELRLGINGGGVGEEQVFVGLFGIGFLGALLNEDTAMENTF